MKVNEWSRRSKHVEGKEVTINLVDGEAITGLLLAMCQNTMNSVIRLSDRDVYIRGTKVNSITRYKPLK